MVKAGDYNFFYGKGNKQTLNGNRIFCTPQNSINC